MRELIEIIRKRRVKDSEDDKIQVIIYDEIHEQWVRRFLACHSELVSIRPRSIDVIRVKDTSLERLQHWFDDLKKMLVEYNIKLENIYNMDENGFAIDEKEAERCIINVIICQ